MSWTNLILQTNLTDLFIRRIIVEFDCMGGLIHTWLRVLGGKNSARFIYQLFCPLIAPKA